MAKIKPSNTKAVMALAKASLLASFRNPSSIVFGFLFPFVFILVFGFLGNGGNALEVGVLPTSNDDNPIYATLSEIENIDLVQDLSVNELNEQLLKGQIDAIIDIQFAPSQGGLPIYDLDVQTSSASAQNGALFLSILDGISDKLTLNQLQIAAPVVEVNNTEVEGRQFKTIDFILPGQLGFSLLSSGVFSTAFVFISLKETLVIKRFFATPIKKSNIVMGEGLARLVFATMQASVIILVGKLFFGYTLINGIVTFIFMLALAMLALMVFLGFGFVVSSVAKDESAVPAIANLITLPQFLLAGTFFPIESFPEWLQPISRILPLTYLNEAMRQVAFEGASLIDVKYEILILVIWGVVIYALAVKLFKWE